MPHLSMHQLLMPLRLLQTLHQLPTQNQRSNSWLCTHKHK
jgi:hypothetical protein